MKRILITFIVLVSSGQLFAQEVQLKGRIVDAQHVPIPGVNVLVMGTSNGTATNFDGYFELRVSPGTNKLLFTYRGYKTLKKNLSIEKGNYYELEVMMMDKGFNIAGLKSAVKKFVSYPVESKK
jgi:hypothetical protein